MICQDQPTSQHQPTSEEFRGNWKCQQIRFGILDRAIKVVKVVYMMDVHDSNDSWFG